MSQQRRKNSDNKAIFSDLIPKRNVDFLWKLKKWLTNFEIIVSYCFILCQKKTLSEDKNLAKIFGENRIYTW